MPAGRLEIAGRGAARKALRIFSGSSGPAFEAAAEPGDLAGVVEVAAIEGAEQAIDAALVGTEAGDPSRASGNLARTSGQAASSRSMPFETISLPTNATSGSRRSVAARPEPLGVDAGRPEAGLLPQPRDLGQRLPERQRRVVGAERTPEAAAMPSSA